MLEGKALVVAIMMLTAAPLVVTDDGRAIVGDVTRDVTDIFTDSEPLPAEDPKLDEVEACEKYLKQQIELINPKIVLALGRIAAQNLLKSSTPIGKMRGNSYLYPDSNLPVVVTYHPAYLLRSPTEKRKVWEDLKFAQNIFRGLI